MSQTNIRQPKMMINQQMLIDLMKIPLEQLMNLSQRIEKSELLDSSQLAAVADTNIVDENLCNAQREVVGHVAKNRQISESNKKASVLKKGNAEMHSRGKSLSNRESRAKSHRVEDFCCSKTRKDILTELLKKEIDLVEFSKDKNKGDINEEALVEMEGCMQVLQFNIAYLGSKLESLQGTCPPPVKGKEINPVDIKSVFIHFRESIHQSIRSVRKFSYHSWLIAGAEKFEKSLFKEVNNQVSKHMSLTGKRIVQVGDSKLSFDLSTDMLSMQKIGSDIVFRGKGALAREVDKSQNSGHERRNHKWLEKSKEGAPHHSSSPQSSRGRSAHPMYDEPLNSNNSNAEESHVCFRRKTSIFEVSERRKSCQKRLPNMHYYKISNDLDSCSDDLQPSQAQQESAVVKRKSLTNVRTRNLRQRQTNASHPRANNQTPVPATYRKGRWTKQFHSSPLPTSADRDRIMGGGDDDGQPRKEKSSGELMVEKPPLYDSDSDTFYSCKGESSDASSLSGPESSAEDRDQERTFICRAQRKRVEEKKRMVANWSQTRTRRERVVGRKNEGGKSGTNWDNGGNSVRDPGREWKLPHVDSRPPSTLGYETGRFFEVKGNSLDSEAIETMGNRLDETMHDVRVLANAYLNIYERLEKLEQQRTEEWSSSALTKESKSKPNTETKVQLIRNALLNNGGRLTACLNTETNSKTKKRRFFKFSK